MIRRRWSKQVPARLNPWHIKAHFNYSDILKIMCDQEKSLEKSQDIQEHQHWGEISSNIGQVFYEPKLKPTGLLVENSNHECLVLYEKGRLSDPKLVNGQLWQEVRSIKYKMLILQIELIYSEKSSEVYLKIKYMKRSKVTTASGPYLLINIQVSMWIW